jgi:hypothetical protein
MILIHEKIFFDVFHKNYDLYNDFMKVIQYEYKQTILDLKNSKTVLDIRNNTHKLVSIISNLMSTSCDELLYICKLLLFNEKTCTVDFYLPYVKEIIEYDKHKIGL